MINISLNGKWKVINHKLSSKNIAGLIGILKLKSNWMQADIPGEIHLDLVRAGKLDEPLKSLNAKKSRGIERYSWWFKKEFNVSADFLEHEEQQLIFNGLDFYAQVFLNGKLLGETNNAFIPWKFNVKNIIKKNNNQLVVRLTTGAELLPRKLQPKISISKKTYGGRQRFPGISHLRKPQFSYGWDWVDALPNIGIWRNVELSAHSGIKIADCIFDTQIENKIVFLNSKIVVENLHPWSEREGKLIVKITSSDKNKIIHKVNFSAQVGKSTLNFSIKISNPKLWWPNGMGEQPLYQVEVKIISGKKVCDKKRFNIGLRTVKIDRTKLPSGGSRFCLNINGEDVFCKGGNWIPADALIARVDKKKYETLVAEAKYANCNMLRIWGGGIYESEHFYNACDRAGILIWQDFMFACSEYPDHLPDFRLNVRNEAEAVVKLLRHHPSIALWCGNNENIWGFDEWWNADKKNNNLRLGGSIIYNKILPDVCLTFDPTRPYWPGSPCGGKKPNSETAGDCHWWHPFTMNKDINRRINDKVFDECKARFVSEYGVIGPCHFASIKQYLNPDEHFVNSAAWKEHTNQFEKETLPAAIKYHYVNPENLNINDYILYGQMFQAITYGKTIEALRFRKHDPIDDCQGALIWMFNDCWGEIGWTPIDYYLRRKPSYYWIRKANVPVKIITRQRGGKLITRIINDTLKSMRLTAHYGWVRLDGSESKVKSKVVNIAANSMLELGNDIIKNQISFNPKEWIYVAYLSSGRTIIDTTIWQLLPYRELKISESQISVKINGNKITFLSKSYCHGVHYKDAGKVILSDNYFDLLPNVPKTIKVLKKINPTKLKFKSL